MRILSALLPLIVAGCSTSQAPEGPTLPETLTFKHVDYQDAGGLLPIVGTLELTIEPNGEAKSACRRQILTDVERTGPLSRRQLVELVTRVEIWTAKAGEFPPAAGKNHGLIVYGAKKAGWEKDASLPPELADLVRFLLTIPPTLRVKERPRK
jgi:hypothetical protein